MEYAIDKLAQLASVSSRTLRYYDQIGLLKPLRVSSSGYRIYGAKEVDRLQQILFYKELGFSLEQIKAALEQPDFDLTKALMQQRELLVEKRRQLDALLATVEKTIRYQKGENKMTDQEKFAAFKKEKLAENEVRYGKEIRASYGEETVNASNQKFMRLSPADMEQMRDLETELFEQLAVVERTGELDSPAAQKAYEAHKQWLCFTWPTYSLQAHQGLVQMYLADERFQQYYDVHGAGVTQLLHDVVMAQPRK